MRKILILSLIAVFIISGCTSQESDKNKMAEKFKNQTNPEGANGSGNDPSQQACPENLSGFFTHHFADLEKIRNIIPLGAFGGPAHVFPPDHVYVEMKTNGTVEDAVRSPIYAPVAGRIGYIEEVLFDKKDGSPVVPEFYIPLTPCEGLQVGYNHVRNISDKLRAAMDAVDPKWKACKNYTFEGGFTSYQCGYNVDILVKAGEQLATSPKMDLGLRNYNIQPLPFANLDRYEDDKYTLCPFDPFPDDMKEEYLKIMGDNGVFRTAEPRCGTIMLDIPGTAQGFWYGSASGEVDLSQKIAVLAPMNYNPEVLGIGLGFAFPTQGLLRFRLRTSGTINREFSKISPSSTIYCYYNDGTGDCGAEWKILIQMTDETHLKIEQQNGSCSGNEEFISPFNFER